MHSVLHLAFFSLMLLRFLRVVVLFILPGIFDCVDIPYIIFQTGSHGYPQVFYITEAGPELLILLSLSPKLWNYKHMLSCPSHSPADGHCGKWRLVLSWAILNTVLVVTPISPGNVRVCCFEFLALTVLIFSSIVFKILLPS